MESRPGLVSETLVDSHCHLQMPQFDRDRDQVLREACEAGVEYIILVGSDSEDNARALTLAEQHEFLFAVTGIHPHDASCIDDSLWSSLRKWAEHPKTVGIGETGLDYHYMHSPRQVQRDAFVRHAELARETGLPLVIHSREARDETLEIMHRHCTGLRGVLHCFSGDLEMAGEAIRLGFLISIAGPVTYKKADELRRTVKAIPIEHMLVETDAPYLAPMPFRGKRNSPAYVVHTARKIAEIKGLSLDDVARITSLNAARLFGIGAPAEAEGTGKIAYPIRNSLYLNITNRCTNRCSFCIRYRDEFVKGHNLQLETDPSASDIISAVGNPSTWDEVVFCGYGEPLLRLEAVKKVSAWLKKEGKRVRINTNGHGNLINGRNILPELKGLVDAFSVSLNAEDSDTYQRICRPDDHRAWEATVDFVRKAVQEGFEVLVTVVDVAGVDVAHCESIAKGLGASFRVRHYDVVG